MKAFAFLISGFLISGCATRQLDYTRGESSVCEVHGGVMVKKTVPAFYGLMSVDQRDQAMTKVAARLFPHAEQSVNPGCDPRGPQSAVVFDCLECERARNQWELNYDSKR